MWEAIELPNVVAAVFAGLVMGGLYFGGLWWTVQRMPQARHPLKLYFGSLIVRLAAIVTAFYLVLAFASLPGLVAALVGFVGARMLSIRLLGWSASDDMPRRGLA